MTAVVAAVTVAALESDPLARRGVAAYLGTYPGITPVTEDGLDRADVVLVLASQVSAETLALMGLPEDARGWLQSRIRGIKPDAPGPRDLTGAGLVNREVDVLRLLADGHDTLEIAERLNYSERTVRNIIHGVLTRMKLRNRAHAVAYALRNGVI